MKTEPDLCVHCGNPAVVAGLCAECVERLSSYITQGLLQAGIEACNV